MRTDRDWVLNTVSEPYYNGTVKTVLQGLFRATLVGCEARLARPVPQLTHVRTYRMASTLDLGFVEWCLKISAHHLARN